MPLASKILGVSYDTLRAVNTTLCGGVEKDKKASRIAKNGISGADIVIGTSHAFEDLACSDYVCVTLDVIASVSSAVGCRSVRYYCKKAWYILGMYR
jgi:hypothetical protein